MTPQSSYSRQLRQQLRSALTPQLHQTILAPISPCNPPQDYRNFMEKHRQICSAANIAEHELAELMLTGWLD